MIAINEAFSDEIWKRAEEVLEKFIVPATRLPLADVLAGAMVSFYSINPQFFQVRHVSGTVVLAPVVARQCSLMDVLTRACREHIGVSWICGD